MSCVLMTYCEVSLDSNKYLRLLVASKDFVYACSGSLASFLLFESLRFFSIEFG